MIWVALYLLVVGWMIVRHHVAVRERQALDAWARDQLARRTDETTLPETEDPQ